MGYHKIEVYPWGCDFFFKSISPHFRILLLQRAHEILRKILVKEVNFILYNSLEEIGVALDMARQHLEALVSSVTW